MSGHLQQYQGVKPIQRRDPPGPKNPENFPRVYKGGIQRISNSCAEETFKIAQLSEVERLFSTRRSALVSRTCTSFEERLNRKTRWCLSFGIAKLLPCPTSSIPFNRPASNPSCNQRFNASPPATSSSERRAGSILGGVGRSTTNSATTTGGNSPRPGSSGIASTSMPRRSKPSVWMLLTTSSPPSHFTLRSDHTPLI